MSSKNHETIHIADPDCVGVTLDPITNRLTFFDDKTERYVEMSTVHLMAVIVPAVQCEIERLAKAASP